MSKGGWGSRVPDPNPAAEALLLAPLLASTLALAAPGPHRVHLQGDFHGIAFDTPLRVEAAPPAGDAADVLDANAVAFGPLARWVEASAAAVDLDDYGRLNLVVTAVDALPVRVGDLRGEPRTVSEALETGSWTAEDRLLAIGGALRALDLAVTPFVNGRGDVLLGLSLEGDDLNVNGVEHRWRVVSGGRARSMQVSWTLWDGAGRVGELAEGRRVLQGVRALVREPPRGRALVLGPRILPAFTLRRTEARRLAVHGTDRVVTYRHHPDAAAWLALRPERTFAGAIADARADVRRTGLAAGLARALADAPDEGAWMDTLLRTVQAGFVYEPGPVRSLIELADDGRGDCDQLSLLVAAVLLEVGYGEDEVVALSWPDHLGLAIRPRTGRVPAGAAAVDLPTGRHVLLDVTHYRYADGRLVSRWGQVAPEHGRDVRVVRLASRG